MATYKLLRLPRELKDFEGTLAHINNTYIPVSQEAKEDCYEIETSEYSYSTCITLKCESRQGYNYTITFSYINTTD